jgi:hypothetical protein
MHDFTNRYHYGSGKLAGHLCGMQVCESYFLFRIFLLPWEGDSYLAPNGPHST